MHFLTQYVDAIKNLNKKYYLTPFLILAYASIIFSVWDSWRHLTDFDYGVADIARFFLSLLYAYKLMIIQIFFYPHASFFIQTTLIYRKVFKGTGSVLSKGVFKFIGIGKDIPDDYYVRGSHGNVYTVGSGHKTKSERVNDARSLYGVYFIMKFFFIDIVLRLFTHLGILAVSPLLFFIAVPVLEKKGLLLEIEK